MNANEVDEFLKCMEDVENGLEPLKECAKKIPLETINTVSQEPLVHLAAIEQRSEALQALEEVGANLDIRDGSGYSALYKAVRGYLVTSDYYKQAYKLTIIGFLLQTLPIRISELLGYVCLFLLGSFVPPPYPA